MKKLSWEDFIQVVLATMNNVVARLGADAAAAAAGCSHPSRPGSGPLAAGPGPGPGGAGLGPQRPQASVTVCFSAAEKRL